MQKYADVILDRRGNPVYGASVLVRTIAGTTATVYATDGGTPITNPIVADDLGRFSFYAADGRYSLSVYVGAVLVGSASDILLEDPADVSEANFNGGSIANAALTGITIDGETPEDLLAATLASAIAADPIKSIYSGLAGSISGPLTGKGRFYPPKSVALSKASAWCGTAPSGSALVLAVKKNGTTIATLTINATENAATPVILSPAEAVATTDYLTVDVVSGGAGDITVRLDY